MAFLRIHKRTSAEHENLKKNDLIWALGSVCTLKRMPFDAEALVQQFRPPYTTHTLIVAAKSLNLRILRITRPSCKISGKTLPSLALVKENKTRFSAGGSEDEFTLDLITHVSNGHITYISSCSNLQKNIRCDDYARRYSGNLFLVAQENWTAKYSDT
jgi:subfamily B ATP-binding cassette protein HlyB/CyaB